MRQLSIDSLRNMRRQPFDRVVPHDVVGPAFELAIPYKLLADVLSRFFMFGEQPFMGRVPRSARPEGLGLQEAVHLLLEGLVVLEGVVAVRRFSTQEFCQIRASRVARRPVVRVSLPDLSSRSAVDVGVGVRCRIDIQRSLRVSVSQQMVESPSLQFASLHRRPSSFVFYLKI